MKFIDMECRMHLITKVTTACGGGFIHSYKDERGNYGECFLPKIAFDRLTKCGAIYVLQ